ncbi:MAG: hypothetical protein KIT84_32600 [Labilithrix sp.]|nr:hypothetical protein [Labilithrix sp.]MCW5815815.1 hypothetical protein [Labilithrix sp.]
MTVSKHVVAALVAAGISLCSSVASAEPTAQEKEHARDLMAEGRDRRDRNDLAGALDSFKQADAIMHVPTTGYEVARTQQMLGQLVEARATVDAIAKLPASPTDPAPFTEARAKAEALAKELDRQIPQLKIAVKSEGKAATVTIDDAPLASLDAPARVNPGKHVVVGRTDDGEAREEITVAAGQTKDVELRIEKNHVAAAPPATTAEKKLAIPTLSWIGFGVGAAGLAVGTVTGLMAIGDESDIADRCQGTRCGRDVEPDLDSAKTKATISTIGFIVAGVGVAVGVVGLFVGQPKTETKVGNVRLDFTRMRAVF